LYGLTSIAKFAEIERRKVIARAGGRDIWGVLVGAEFLFGKMKSLERVVIVIQQCKWT
jgi:hypothetical protein